MKKILMILILFTNMLNAKMIKKFNITKDTNLIIKKGDITKSRVEAIVNAANEQLQGGGGVCGAIFDVAGWSDLQAACDVQEMKNGKRCPIGNAIITPSFGLKSKGIDYIIHAVGPDCRIVKDPKLQDFLLENAYKNSLLLADKKSIKSIAFPFISSSIYAFPKERAALLALKTVTDYLKNNASGIKSIYFVLFSQEDYDLFNNTMKELNI